MKDKSDARRKPGERAHNHLTRLMHVAPHMAKQLMHKTPGLRHIWKDGTPNKHAFPPVAGGRHED